MVLEEASWMNLWFVEAVFLIHFDSRLRSRASRVESAYRVNASDYAEQYQSNFQSNCYSADPNDRRLILPLDSHDTHFR